MLNRKLAALIDKAVFDYNLIEDGDRILLGISGGKDSTLLAEYLSLRTKRFLGKTEVNPAEPRFVFKSLHIHSEIEGPLSDEIKSLYNSWNIDVEEKQIDVLGRLKLGRTMNCYWCSTQRRKELLDFAIANGYNKIALGHHLDDILETLIMNSTEHAELSTMPVRLQYEKFPVTVIRPLCYVPVTMIVEQAEAEKWKSLTCTCTYQDNSARKDARRKLSVLCDDDYNKKMHLFNSLKNIQKEYLP